MTDAQKTAIGHFSATFTLPNEPYAKAELAKLMHDFTLGVRNIDGGTVFRLPGSVPVSASGTADFSGWTDAALDFQSDRDAPFPFVNQEHPREPGDPQTGDIPI